MSMKGKMATKATSTPGFWTGLIGGVAFRSLHGQFGIGTGLAGGSSDVLGRGVEREQQQPHDQALVHLGPFSGAAFFTGRTASRQHHPWGNAKVRLQASITE
jgi:hypothetical protein